MLRHIAGEYLIQPCAGGIKLMSSHTNHSSQWGDTKVRYIADVLKMPCNVYFLNTESEVLTSNEAVLHSHNAFSLRDMIGRSVFALYDKKTATQVRMNDNAVLKHNQTKIYEEGIVLHDDRHDFSCLSVEAPLYNEDHDVIGLFGCSIIYGQHSLPDALTNITSLGLLTPQAQLSKAYNGALLSKREKQCLFHYARGNSASQIAARLNLSRRTVEHYLEGIKHKLKVNSKSELLELITDF